MRSKIGSHLEVSYRQHTRYRDKQIFAQARDRAPFEKSRRLDRTVLASCIFWRLQRAKEPGLGPAPVSAHGYRLNLQYFGGFRGNEGPPLTPLQYLCSAPGHL